MLRGTTSINLDSKGRLAIPTRYREELQECCESQLIVTVAVNERCIGEQGCLWLYPLPEWEKLEQTILKLPNSSEAAGYLKRFVIGNATECELDAQGRFLVPEKLRSFAQMDKKIVLVGMLNKFEVWNEDAWNAKEQAWMNGGNISGLEDLESISF